MIVKYIHASGIRERISFDFKGEADPEFVYLTSSNKLECIKKFIPAFYKHQKMVMFDAKHKQLLDFYNNNDINKLDKIEDIDAELLFFTSGSNGFPLGAFKTRDNLLKEVEVLKNILKEHSIKRVIVTVPFIHIYGVLAGLLLPMSLGDVKLIVKEDFLPYELVEEASHKNTLVITTPVFIKSLVKLSEKRDLSSSVFMCSTSPLDNEDIKIFESLYQADILQLFGSTETGGIAYKFGNTNRWVPLSGVKVSSVDDKLTIESPFISSYILNEKIYPLGQPFVSEDLVSISDEGFSLLGRSNKILKIAGKRISTTQIESILETFDDINIAVVELVYKKELLKSEQLLITLEVKSNISKKDIKIKLNEYYGVLTIPFKIKYVDEIEYSALGKKILFKQ